MMLTPTITRCCRITQREIVAVLGLVCLALVLLGSEWIARTEDSAYRLAVRIASPATSASIAVAPIDAAVIDAQGAWPWPAKTIGTIIEQLRARGATLIVLDPQVTKAWRPQANASQNEDLAAGYQFVTEHAEAIDAVDIAALAEAWGFPTSPEHGSLIPKAAGIDAKELLPAQTQIAQGFVHVLPDADGTTRRTAFAMRLDGHAFPSLALVAAARRKGFTPILTQDAKGHASGISIGGVRIHTGADARAAIAFRRTESIPTISVAELLSRSNAPAPIDAQTVLVGVVDPAIVAPVVTPLGTMSIIHLEAQVMEDLMAGGMLRLLTGMIPRALLIIFLTGLWAFAIVQLRPWTQILAAIGIAGALGIGSILLVQWAGVQLPTVTLLAMTAILFTSAGWANLIARIIPRRLLLRHFRHRLNRRSIEAILADPSCLAPSTPLHEATVLVVDIKGFGAISGRLTPRTLARFVRLWRTLVSDTLTEAGALIDSWAGDECRAIFGAPVAMPDHAQQACRAALTLRASIAAQREAWAQDFGIEGFRIGIGIQTGQATAHDLGPERAFEYGAVGPAVEAAMQLRALCRAYGTTILVGELTQAACIGTLAFRRLDAVQLRGEENPSPLFELIGEHGIILPQREAFQSGLEAYLAGNYEDAAFAFQSIVAEYPNDGPARLFLARARKHRDS